MLRTISAACLLFITVSAHAWNGVGHQLVAQIAYNNLTPAAKQMCDEYTHSYSTVSFSTNFVTAAAWMDLIRLKDIHWYDTLHYIDIPFTKDKTALPAVQDMNALWGIKQAMAVLASSKSTSVDKGLSLRILTHLVGDIHQPLHTVTKVSKRLPGGDLGGNLFKLAHNPIGDNLHKYWDNGGGVLIGGSKKFQVQNKARQLENKWSCDMALKEKNPQKWINESHQLALTQVYNTRKKKVPSKKYQLSVQNISQKQILFAGCRLADLLNGIAKEQQKANV